MLVRCNSSFFFVFFCYLFSPSYPCSLSCAEFMNPNIRREMISVESDPITRLPLPLEQISLNGICTRNLLSNFSYIESSVLHHCKGIFKSPSGSCCFCCCWFLQRLAISSTPQEMRVINIHSSSENTDDLLDDTNFFAFNPRPRPFPTLILKGVSWENLPDNFLRSLAVDKCWYTQIFVVDFFFCFPFT